jgi:hypothetical protein
MLEAWCLYLEQNSNLKQNSNLEQISNLKQNLNLEQISNLEHILNWNIFRICRKFEFEQILNFNKIIM